MERCGAAPCTTKVLVALVIVVAPARADGDGPSATVGLCLCMMGLRLLLDPFNANCLASTDAMFV